MIFAKTDMDKMPDSCVRCSHGERYGCVGDVKCRILGEYFTNNTKPPYKERPDECPLIDMNNRNILINPGSGPVGGEVSWDNAYENITAYIADCEIPMRIVRSEHEPDEGRYLFVLRNDEYDYQIEVDMPGLPLERVRYVKGDKRSILDFPRVYVDGGSWIWYIATVKKDVVREVLEERIDKMKEELEKVSRQIKELSEGT